MGKSLGDAFPEEQARLRRLLQQYREIGPVGIFGATMIEDCLRRADQAAISGDVVQMARLYQEMREFEE